MVSFVSEECILDVGFSFYYGLKKMIVLTVQELDLSIKLKSLETPDFSLLGLCFPFLQGDGKITLCLP